MCFGKILKKLVSKYLRLSFVMNFFKFHIPIFRYSKLHQKCSRFYLIGSTIEKNILLIFVTFAMYLFILNHLSCTSIKNFIDEISFLFKRRSCAISHFS